MYGLLSLVMTTMSSFESKHIQETPCIIPCCRPLTRPNLNNRSTWTCIIFITKATFPNSWDPNIRPLWTWRRSVALLACFFGESVVKENTIHGNPVLPKCECECWFCVRFVILGSIPLNCFDDSLLLYANDWCTTDAYTASCPIEPITLVMRLFK